MMHTDAAHTSWWQIGEVVFGTPLLVAIALQLLMPLTFTNVFFTPAFLVVGIVLCAIGMTLIIATRRELSKYSQPTDPGVPTSFIVTSGVFSVSRNPMYLGVVCLLVGIALVFRLAWVFIFLVPTLIACYSILIAPEERYLAAKFGMDYQQYRLVVNRWVGRKLS